MCLLLTTLLLLSFPSKKDISLPVDVPPGAALQLTAIGQFAVERSGRPDIAAHLHTGVDIRRPSENYKNELIYPVARGLVISKRDDGPYAQLICEHLLKDLRFWTVYEHIAGIMVSVGDSLDPAMPLARFMNREELNRYGWQFDHFHFEILKVKPRKIKAVQTTPERFYRSFTLNIFSLQELEKHYYSPLDFLNRPITK